MEKEEIKHKAITGLIWQTAQKFATKFVSLFVSILLARLLSPDDFGLIALTSIFLSIAGIMADSGLGTSLIQKKDIDHLDTNTVFLFGLGVSSVLYLILFFCAPLIAGMYDRPQLIPILRVLGINLLFSSISSVQGSLVSRKLDFKKFFYLSLITTLVSGSVGVAMAFAGCGVWTLVGQSLTASVVGVVVLNRMIKWRPGLEFSFDRLKKLYAFGLNYMGTNLIGTFFNEIRGFLIGLKYQPSDLAFYNRGDSLPAFVNGTITGTLSGVLFPAMSRLQDDKSAVKTSIRRSMMSCSFVLAPLMFLLMGAAENITLLLYTDKWAAAIPFMQVIAVGYLLSIVGNANLQALNAIGRSDITLKLELIKKPVYLGILLYTLGISPLAMAVGNTLYAIFGASVNAFPNKKLIGYGYREQILDIAPQLGLGLLAGVAAYFIGRSGWNIYLTLSLQLVVGLGLYWVLSYLFRLESYFYLRNTLIDFFRKTRAV